MDKYVLVVEDDLSYRNSIKRVFENEGYKTLLADDLNNAVPILNKIGYEKVSVGVFRYIFAWYKWS